jgi:hypothetical protein
MLLSGNNKGNISTCMGVNSLPHIVISEEGVGDKEKGVNLQTANRLICPQIIKRCLYFKKALV